MISAGHLFALCITIFFVYALLVSFEKRRGKRILLSGLRGFFDRVLVKISAFVRYWLTYIGRHIIKLSWYYSLHRFLRLIMTALVKIYDQLELVFMRNRDKARVIKIERKKMKQGSHLEQVAYHKEAVSLTEKERGELLAKKLERE